MITPCIIIPGFGQSKAELYDENGVSAKQVWPLKPDKKHLVKKIAPSYLLTVLTRGDRGFSKNTYKLFRETFLPFEYNESGEKKNRLRCIDYKEPLSECAPKVNAYIKKLVPVKKLAEQAGEKNIFFFAYNAFDDVYETALKLDSFVAYVKNRTGAEKVNLLAYSMGGALACAYFELFGEKTEIEKTLFIAAAIEGSLNQADLMKRNVEKKQGYSLLGFATNEKTVETFKKVLAFTPWSVRYNILYASLDAVVDGVMKHSPGMWQLIPPEDYPALREKYISGEEYAKLREKTDRFYALQQNLPAVLESVRKAGTEFYAFCGYGLRIMPLSASGDISTDGILAVKSASLGAVSAPRDEKLPPEQISPSSDLTDDGMIDKSTGFFGKNAYYFKNMPHAGFASSEEVQNLTADILMSV